MFSHANRNRPLIPPHIEAVIFDCDGTLVDSEGPHERICIQLLGSLGFDVEAAQHALDNCVGLTFAAQMQILAETHGVTLPGDITERYVDMFCALPPEESAEIPGAGEMIALALEKGLKIAVGSNGEPRNVETSLSHAGFSGFFDGLIFTAAMVPRGKPAPDLYLHAAEQLGVRPENCLVFEDSINGARAGIAAGMTVIGIYGTAHDPAARRRDLLGAGIAGAFADFNEALGSADAEKDYVPANAPVCAAK